MEREQLGRYYAPVGCREWPKGEGWEETARRAADRMARFWHRTADAVLVGWCFSSPRCPGVLEGFKLGGGEVYLL
jgi:hypothetical protein